MFNPQEDEVVEHWFQQLNAPLKRLPSEERTRVQEEVWQHLEALAVANEECGGGPETAWESALEQFGDPELFGKQIAEEWRQSRAGFRADISAIIFGIGLAVLLMVVEMLLLNPRWCKLIGTHWECIGWIAFVLGKTIGYTGPLLLNAAIGRKYPSQAIKGALYTVILSRLWYFALLQHSPIHMVVVALTHSIVRMPLWMAVDVTIAQGHSVFLMPSKASAASGFAA